MSVCASPCTSLPAGRCAVGYVSTPTVVCLGRDRRSEPVRIDTLKPVHSIGETLSQ